MFFGPHTAESRAKIGRASVGNKYAAGKPSWNKGKAYLAEEKNPAWKGAKAGNVAIHNWVRRKFGKASFCEFDPTHEATTFHWSNKDHKYRRVQEDWQQLCPKCHWKYDHPKTKNPLLD